ncbi:MAG: alpha/beta fold hydrolase [Myxococcota bacterium]
MTGQPFAALSYPFETRRLTLGDIDVTYAEMGEGPRSILLVHGVGNNIRTWQNNLAPVAEAARVVAVDLPGFGKSSKHHRPYGIRFYAETLVRLCEALGMDTTTVVGHSMGGQIAMRLAIDRPALVERVVLSAPAGLEVFTPAEASLLVDLMSPEAIANTPVAQLQAGFDAAFAQPPGDAAALLDDRLAIMGGPDFADYCNAVADCVAAMLAEPVRGDLGRIAAPTLLLFGEADQLIPNRHLHQGTTEALARDAAANIPDCTVVMLDRAGHMAHFERADRWNAEVLAFGCPQDPKG